MLEESTSLNPPRIHSEPVRAAMTLIESLILEGMRHGHFDYSINCETGTKGRRLLIVKAGKSHKFSIQEPDIPR
jgi:hypothetical protein